MSLDCPRYYTDEFGYECCDICGRDPPCDMYPQICNPDAFKENKKSKNTLEGFI